LTALAEKPCSAPLAAIDAPERWLGSSPLLDLGDPRLRLRAHALTQLCKSEREKAITVYGFVKRIAFAKPLKMRLRTAREVLDAGRGDAPDKVVLLVSMLRLVGIPARIRYVELRGEILRGLTSNITSAARPVAEIWLHQRWVRTDTYIFDAGYMAAARQRLKEHDWEWGYGIHRNGHSIWNGVDSAYVGSRPTEEDPMVVADLGVFSDPQEFVSSEIYRRNHARLARALHWNLLAPLMGRSIRELREDSTFGNTTTRARKVS
jgi:hypothetical protein